MSTYIHAIATATPQYAITQDDAHDWAVQLSDPGPRKGTARAIYRKSGVGQRHSVVLDGQGGPISFYTPGEDAPSTSVRMRKYVADTLPLATRSTARALEDAGVPANTIDHLVAVSCTGFGAPGWDTGLYQAVGLSPDCPRTQVGFMGCHGAFNGIRAAALAVGTNKAPALVCCTELCSLHHHYGWDPEKIVANALFADGSAAAVLSDQREGAVAKFVASTSRVVPDTADLMSWHIGDHGFEMTLDASVPDVIAGSLHQWLSDWLTQYDVRVSDVAGWAVHPGGPRILLAVEESLDLDSTALDASKSVLADYGNMSSPTVLFILDRLRQHVRGPVVALGFGPGLTFEAMLLQLLD